MAVAIESRIDTEPARSARNGNFVCCHYLHLYASLVQKLAAMERNGETITDAHMRRVVAERGWLDPSDVYRLNECWKLYAYLRGDDGR